MTAVMVIVLGIVVLVCCLVLLVSLTLCLLASGGRNGVANGCKHSPAPNDNTSWILGSILHEKIRENYWQKVRFKPVRTQFSKKRFVPNRELNRQVETRTGLN
ncbi:hypothetical protein BYT27DRAFT_7207573 [Phlegmacium glaucopus]|nr:hypothetical protein BYT27DRAFT_7207573 [Phlegmacium glaucopus]